MPRSQTTLNTKKRKVLIGIWVEPEVKDEIERIARKEGLGKGNDLSLSSVGAALLKKQLQHHLDMQYGALLEPIIERCIDRKMEGMTTKLAWLLVRVAFDVGQVRGMTTNILGRQPGMNQDILTTILKESSKAAKMNITRRTPQLTELMEVLNKWLSGKGKEEKIGG